MAEGGRRRRVERVLDCSHASGAVAAALTLVLAVVALAVWMPVAAPALHTVAVVTANGARLLDDVYTPATSAAGRPVMVLVHGGAWEGGEKSYLSAQARRLAAAGWVAVNVDYRTAAAGGPPPELADVEASLRWVAGHLGVLRGDPARVALLGESAGGHLAALAALDGAAHPATTGVRVAAVVSWSGILDLPGLAAAASGAPAWLEDAAARLVGCRLAACPALWAAASPVDQVAGRAAPPMLLVNSLDEIVPAAQARAMAARLEAGGGTGQLALLPGDRHAVAYADAVWPRTAAFLGAVLRVGAPAGVPDQQLPGRATLVAATLLAAACGPAATGVATRRQTGCAGGCTPPLRHGLDGRAGAPRRATA